MRITKVAFVVLFLFSAPAWTENNSARPMDEISKLSDKQHFQVQFTSNLNLIVINTMHAWTLHIQNSSGESVTDATVQIKGGMPAHDHGLPTRPRITQNLGNGDYLLEGMKFHMGGQWQVTLTIQQGRISDRVTFNLNL